MAHAALDVAALGLDDLGGVGFQRVAEGIVRGQEEPVLAAVVHHRTARALGQGPSVIGIVDGVGRALLVGQGRGAGAVVDVDALLLLGHLGQRQGHAGVGATEQHGQVLRVDPFARLGGGNVRLVLMVLGQQLNGLTQHLATEIIDGHLDGQGTVLAVHVRVVAGHVGDEANLDLVGLLRVGQASNGQRQGQGGQGRTNGVHGAVSLLLWCVKSVAAAWAQTPRNSLRTGILASSCAASKVSTMRPCSIT